MSFNLLSLYRILNVFKWFNYFYIFIEIVRTKLRVIGKRLLLAVFYLSMYNNFISILVIITIGQNLCRRPHGTNRYRICHRCAGVANRTRSGHCYWYYLGYCCCCCYCCWRPTRAFRGRTFRGCSDGGASTGRWWNRSACGHRPGHCAARVAAGGSPERLIRRRPRPAGSATGRRSVPELSGAVRPPRRSADPGWGWSSPGSAMMRCTSGRTSRSRRHRSWWGTWPDSTNTNRGRQLRRRCRTVKIRILVVLEMKMGTYLSDLGTVAGRTVNQGKPNEVEGTAGVSSLVDRCPVLGGIHHCWNEKNVKFVKYLEW